MTKQEQIDQHLAKPYEIGETVIVRGLGRQDKKLWGDSIKIEDINETGVFIQRHNYAEKEHYKFEDIKKFTHHIGSDPFPKRKDNSVVVLYSLESLLKDTDVNSTEVMYEINGFPIKKSNDNPVIFDKDGNVQPYQRSYCWSLEEKQCLIESIYQGMGCGLVVVRRRSDEELKRLADMGIKNLALLDIVDGKQRMAAVHEFVKDGFADMNGLVFSEFSNSAKHKFWNFMGFTYVQLPENTTDQEVRDQFLRTNFTGVPQSREHLDYVKSIEF